MSELEKKSKVSSEGCTTQHGPTDNSLKRYPGLGIVSFNNGINPHGRMQRRSISGAGTLSSLGHPPISPTPSFHCHHDQPKVEHGSKILRRTVISSTVTTTREHHEVKQHKNKSKEQLKLGVGATFVKSGSIGATSVKSGSIGATFVKSGSIGATSVKSGSIVAADVDGDHGKMNQRKRSYDPSEVKGFIEKQRETRKAREKAEAEAHEEKEKKRLKQLAELDLKCRELLSNRPVRKVKKANPVLTQAMTQGFNSGSPRTPFKVPNHLPATDQGPVVSRTKLDFTNYDRSNLRTSALLRAFEEIVHQECMNVLSPNSQSLKVPDPSIELKEKVDKCVETSWNFEKDLSLGSQFSNNYISPPPTNLETPQPSAPKKDFIPKRKVKDRVRATNATNKTRSEAAIKIQSVFRGYRVRKILHQLKVHSVPVETQTDANLKSSSLKRSPGTSSGLGLLRASKVLKEYISPGRHSFPESTTLLEHAQRQNLPAGSSENHRIPLVESMTKARSDHVLHHRSKSEGKYSSMTSHDIKFNIPFPKDLIERPQPSSLTNLTNSKLEFCVGSPTPKHYLRPPTTFQKVPSPTFSRVLREKLRLMNVNVDEMLSAGHIPQDPNGSHHNNLLLLDNDSESDLTEYAQVKTGRSFWGDFSSTDSTTFTSFTDDYIGPTISLDQLSVASDKAQNPRRHSLILNDSVTLKSLLDEASRTRHYSLRKVDEFIRKRSLEILTESKQNALLQENSSISIYEDSRSSEKQPSSSPHKEETKAQTSSTPCAEGPETIQVTKFPSPAKLPSPSSPEPSFLEDRSYTPDFEESDSISREVSKRSSSFTSKAESVKADDVEGFSSVLEKTGPGELSFLKSGSQDVVSPAEERETSKSLMVSSTGPSINARSFEDEDSTLKSKIETIAQKVEDEANANIVQSEPEPVTLSQPQPSELSSESIQLEETKVESTKSKVQEEPEIVQGSFSETPELQSPERPQDQVGSYKIPSPKEQDSLPSSVHDDSATEKGTEEGSIALEFESDKSQSLDQDQEESWKPDFESASSTTETSSSGVVEDGKGPSVELVLEESKEGIESPVDDLEDQEDHDHEEEWFEDDFLTPTSSSESPHNVHVFFPDEEKFEASETKTSPTTSNQISIQSGGIVKSSGFEGISVDVEFLQDILESHKDEFLSGKFLLNNKISESTLKDHFTKSTGNEDGDDEAEDGSNSMISFHSLLLSVMGEISQNRFMMDWEKKKMDDRAIVEKYRAGPLAFTARNSRALKLRDERSILNAVFGDVLALVPPTIPLDSKQSEAKRNIRTCRLSKWICKPKDIVDEVLAEELLDDEIEYTNFAPEELLITEKVCNTVMNRLVRDVVLNFSKAFGSTLRKRNEKL